MIFVPFQLITHQQKPSTSLRQWVACFIVVLSGTPFHLIIHIAGRLWTRAVLRCFKRLLRKVEYLSANFSKLSETCSFYTWPIIPYIYIHLNVQPRKVWRLVDLLLTSCEWLSVLLRFLCFYKHAIMIQSDDINNSKTQTQLISSLSAPCSHCETGFFSIVMQRCIFSYQHLGPSAVGKSILCTSLCGRMKWHRYDMKLYDFTNIYHACVSVCSCACSVFICLWRTSKSHIEVLGSK